MVQIKMLKIIGNLARETGERLGTALGTTLAALGVAQQDINVLVAAVPVVLGLCVDLLSKKYLFGTR